jgi:hypothetical protein
MAKRQPLPEMGMEVDTAELLALAQMCLSKGRHTGDLHLVNAAESVLSALMVVLRERKAVIPEELQPMIAILYGE